MADATISALSAQPTAADADLLAIVDSANHNTNKITKAAFLTGVAPASRKVLAAAATISSSAIATVTGLSAVVSAGGLYRLNAMIMVNKGAAATPTAYGLSFPTMNNIRGSIYVPHSVIATHAITATGQGQRCTFSNGASGSVILSATCTMVSVFAQYDAICDVNATGSIKIMHKAAGGASANTILAGSYIEVIKLN
jgi:hypothetical protein